MVLHVAIDPDYYFIWTLVCLENSLIEKKPLWTSTHTLVNDCLKVLN